jgi:hypothetical protein
VSTRHPRPSPTAGLAGTPTCSPAYSGVGGSGVRASQVVA